MNLTIDTTTIMDALSGGPLAPSELWQRVSRRPYNKAAANTLEAAIMPLIEAKKVHKRRRFNSTLYERA